jgi:hypothetical protein
MHHRQVVSYSRTAVARPRDAESDAWCVVWCRVFSGIGLPVPSRTGTYPLRLRSGSLLSHTWTARNTLNNARPTDQGTSVSRSRSLFGRHQILSPLTQALVSTYQH